MLIAPHRILNLNADSHEGHAAERESARNNRNGLEQNKHSEPDCLHAVSLTYIKNRVPTGLCSLQILCIVED